MFRDSTPQEINEVMNAAWAAFLVYRKKSLHTRAQLMRGIALEIEACGVALIETAMKETHLPQARLENERNRTIFQLNSYADFCEAGQWLDARIDTADASRTPPKPGIRKMLVPLGPVVVFGASNFPFAYSTAGGDTACALAAGCPVVVKAHPAHAETSEMVAAAISRAVAKMNLPAAVFTHVHGASTATGESLVKHQHTKAVGFTGSYTGGKQLFDWGNQRAVPIPVFAEMGSVNPVFLLPQKLTQDAASIAKQCAGSITLGAGQFCTNPGIIIGQQSEGLESFINALNAEIGIIIPAAMLHTGIYKSYVEKRAAALSQPGVEMLGVSKKTAAYNEASPTIAAVAASAFLENSLLHQEVFGPYSLLVKCDNAAEMLAVAQHLEGQLTATLMGTEEDIKNNSDLVEAVENLCGRIILNGIPTGVEVNLSMQHGGPFPASTDSRFTSVGADGIRRFARPLSFQNWPDTLLPDELKDENPLGIYRTIDNHLKLDKHF